MQPLGTRRLIFKSEGADSKVGYIFNSRDFETFQNVANVDIVLDTVLATGNILAKLMSFATRCHNLLGRRLLLLHVRKRAALG